MKTVPNLAAIEPTPTPVLLQMVLMLVNCVFQCFIEIMGRVNSVYYIKKLTSDNFVHFMLQFMDDCGTIFVTTMPNGHLPNDCRVKLCR